YLLIRAICSLTFWQSPSPSVPVRAFSGCCRHGCPTECLSRVGRLPIIANVRKLPLLHPSLVPPEDKNKRSVLCVGSRAGKDGGLACRISVSKPGTGFASLCFLLSQSSLWLQYRATKPMRASAGV